MTALVAAQKAAAAVTKAPNSRFVRDSKLPPF
jgi:hypothetical protein